MKNKSWTVMSIPGNEAEPTSWYVYNLDTHKQVKYDSFEEARDAVRELNGK